MGCAAPAPRRRPARFHLLAALLLSTVMTSLPVAAGQVRQAAPAGAPPANAADPANLVRREVLDLYEFFRTNPAPMPEELLTFVEERIAPHFDFDYMARWSAGPYLRRLDDDQLGQLATQVRTLFIAGLARGLGMLGETLPRVRVLQARPGRDAREQVVPVLASLRPGLDARLSFRCYWTGETWRVFDASLNGASAVAFFRRHFAQMLRRHGPEALGRPIGGSVAESH